MNKINIANIHETNIYLYNFESEFLNNKTI